MKTFFKSAYIALLSGALLTGCADRLDISPKDSVPSSNAINNRASAAAAINGLYSDVQDPTLAFDGLIALNQMFSDECIHTGTFPTRLEFGSFNVFPANTTMAAVFSDFYDVINIANNIIELVPAVEDESFTQEDRDNFVAQARFVRAYMYMYIAENWGTAPLVLDATAEVGDVLNVPNSTKAAIYTQIFDDLNYAKDNLSASNGSAYATPDAATAVLARCHLMNGNYAEALAEAESLIDVYALSADYAGIFAGDLSEVIWYLDFNSIDANTNAFFYFSDTKGGRQSISPSPELIAAYEDGDVRFAASIDTSTAIPHGIKYNDIAAGTDPIYMIRYAEILLIAAEAAAEGGDYAAASSYVNEVRARAGLGEVTLDASNYVEVIFQEKFVELAMETPLRTWDIRRRGMEADYLVPVGYEDPCDGLWPIPQRDLDRNPNLGQNECY
ncbi:RagB/SusD family nutrient uptake outer membrane protein [Pontibacter sp. G13]|uniref:RagB/SusD family nutrient uptake outer membrane protein n=1 Tax=Pontibacter sp. G13 TaxID=3074898 RepID=UPI00288AB940|nr:RagB/SusD family nutrient uptake outer membrane protein [Pontibacter sp. G13]WNJ20167.1 RagB/SusD family nutrient uptake outer membrane protein [Pontibacter sp. G13]